MNASGTETALGDLKSAAFAEQKICFRHANICKRYFRVSVRRVVITENVQHSFDLYAFRVHRDEYHRLLQMFRRRSRPSCP